MTEIASFFAPAAAPASGGAAVASGKNGVGASAFAALLSQVQNQGTQSAAGPQTGAPTPDAILQQLQSLLANAGTGSAPVTAQLAASDILAGASNGKGEVDLEALIAQLTGQSASLDASQFPALLQAQLAAEGQSAGQATQANLATPKTASQGKPDLTAEQLAQLKSMAADPLNAANADPAFARLIADAIAARGQTDVRQAAGTASKGEPGTGLDASATPANASNGTSTQAHATAIDSKTAIGAGNAAGNQQNAQQHSNQSLDFTKSMNAALAAQPGYIPAQPGFTAELMQAQSAQLAAGAPQQVPLDALAVQIARKFDEGSSNFEISLHPAELGKLDISLNVSQDGRVHAVLRAERADTLDLLRQDARSLETQLRQAGLDVGSNSLSFQLSQGGNQRQQANGATVAQGFAQDDVTPNADVIRTSYVAVRKRDGIDIHV